MKDARFNRFLVTGASGFLGHHIVPRLRDAFDAEFVCVNRKNYDLLQPGEPARMMREVQPDCVVHLAAKSGGIVDNKKRPADYFYENVAMNTHVLDAAHKSGVKKFLTLMGGCSYPATAKSPISEDQSSTLEGAQLEPSGAVVRGANLATAPQTCLIGPRRSMAKSIRWIVMSKRSPAPALSLYCRQPQLVSGQSRKRWERKCRGVPRAPDFSR